jgi:hypothetical protein
MNAGLIEAKVRGWGRMANPVLAEDYFYKYLKQ